MRELWLSASAYETWLQCPTKWVLDLKLLLFQAEDLGYPHERIAFNLSQQKAGGTL